MQLVVLTAEGNTALGHTVITLISFILLLLIVRHYAWGPMTKILLERKERIQNDLDKAASEKEQSIQANTAAQLKLKDARAEATQIILNAKKQSLTIQESMLKDAKEEVEAMKQAATKDIELERKRIKNDVKNELADIAIEIAEKILQREITNDDYRHLVDDFIDGMDDLV